MQAVGRARCRLALDGFAVIGEYEQEKKGEPLFTGHAVYTYDPESKRYGCHWVDSMGGQPVEFRGDMVDDTLTLHAHDEKFGHCRLIYDLTRVGDGRYGFQMDMSQDGEQWKPCLEGKYRRTG